jgi:hypothetical protein
VDGEGAGRFPRGMRVPKAEGLRGRRDWAQVSGRGGAEGGHGLLRAHVNGAAGTGVRTSGH